MPKFIDLSNSKFNRWTVLGRADNGPQKQVMWDCLCDCGTKRAVLGATLRLGTSKSCGCLRDEVAAEQIVAMNFRHGLSKTRTHNIWCGMKTRCFNKNSPAYRSYGGRGITVCDRWLVFDNFLTDMGICPDNLTIERINNNGDYDKENCEWETMACQQNNRRNNHALTLNGETLNIQQWSAKLGIKHTTIHERLRRGWSVARALS